MNIMKLCQQVMYETDRRMHELLIEVGKQILLSSEMLPREKLLEIFAFSANRVEIQCVYTEDGFFEFQLDEITDYRIHFDNSIIGRVKANKLPIEEINSILASKYSQTAEMVIGNIFVIYPDMGTIKFIFHDPKKQCSAFFSYEEKEISLSFSKDCTEGMNIIKLYENEISENINHLKGLLTDIGNRILISSESILPERIFNIFTDYEDRVAINCEYEESGWFTFSAENDVRFFDDKCIGRIEAKEDLTKGVNEFLAKRYPGITIDNKFIIYPDPGTIKFFFHFNTSLTESDLVSPFPSCVKYSEECTSKEKLMQNDLVWIFSADLIKMENPEAKISEMCNGEDEILYNIVDITVFSIKTMLFEAAEFKVELPFEPFEMPLKI